MPTTSVALLRGVNVGGHHKISMATLRAVFVEAGFTDVATYLQSGNVVFSHSRRSDGSLTRELEQRISEMTGFPVPVVLRTASELDEVVRSRPFPANDPTKLVVAFLVDAPNAVALDRLDPSRFAPEELSVHGRDLYLHLPNGQARAKLPAALGTLDAAATIRNWRTVTKLLELAQPAASSGGDRPRS